MILLIILATSSIGSSQFSFYKKILVKEDRRWKLSLDKLIEEAQKAAQQPQSSQQANSTPINQQTNSAPTNQQTNSNK